MTYDYCVPNSWVFLEANATDRRSIRGFTRTYNDGRICYLANGHHRDVLESAAVQQMIVQAIDWCLAPRLEMLNKKIRRISPLTKT